MTPWRTVDPGRVAMSLADGGVVLMPTDTLPGFHARLDRPDAVARIAALKGRDQPKPMLVLAASVTAAAAAVQLDAAAADQAARCWPGPYTLILPAHRDVPSDVTAGGRTLGVRVPGHAALQIFLAELGVPLVSTSANVTGTTPARDLDQAAARFGTRVDLIADLPWGGGTEPSTLVDLTRNPPRILRAGAGPAMPDWAGP